MLNRRSLLSVSLAALATPSLARADDGERALAVAVAERFGLNGVILMGQGGQTRFAGGFGVADAEAGRAASADDRYMIASISKWLTALAVLKLVEEGRLALDASIRTWLPSYRADTGASVSLRHLMNNTSGIPNGFNAAVEADPALRMRDLPTLEAVARFCSGDPIFAPGERFDYVGSNWVLVTAIMEAAAGQPYEAVMQQRVLGPLGLTHTGVARSDFLTASDAARAYSSLDPVTLKMAARPLYTAAAGGFFSTAADLMKAANQVYGGPFLAPASLGELTRVTVPEQHYALGGRVARLTTARGPRTAAWETGRTEGYRSVLAHCLEDQRTVVVLNNTDMPQPTMDQIALALLDASFV
jgi:D-alanyl-D-alanine carboxypeptidase